MNSAYIALLYRVSELARRYGLKPSEAEATIDFAIDDPDAYKGQYRLSFDDATGDPERSERFSKMMATLGCKNCVVETNFLDEMEDLVDRALLLAPRARSL